jgi:hypothetical protein
MTDETVQPEEPEEPRVPLLEEEPPDFRGDPVHEEPSVP